MPADVVDRLSTIPERFGSDVLDDPVRCRALLADLLGDRRRELNLLSAAVEMGAVTRLQNAPEISLVLPQLEARLRDEYGLSEANARYALHTWARALGLTIPDTEPSPDARNTEDVTTPPSDDGGNEIQDAWYRGSPGRRWGIAGVVVLLGLLVVLVGSLINDPNGGGDVEDDDDAIEFVTVPNVMGWSLDRAESELRGLGLDPWVVQVESDETPGTVLGTTPGAGRPVEAGSEIVIRVADEAEQELVSVPHVVGAPAADAATALSALGLVPEISHEDSDAAPETVLRTEPPTGTNVDPGSTVRVVVAAQRLHTLTWRIEIGDPDKVLARNDGSCVGLQDFHDFDEDFADEVALWGSTDEWLELTRVPFADGTWEASRFDGGPSSVCAFTFEFGDLPEMEHYFVALPWHDGSVPDRYTPAVSVTRAVAEQSDWSIVSLFR